MKVIGGEERLIDIAAEEICKSEDEIWHNAAKSLIDGLSENLAQLSKEIEARKKSGINYVLVTNLEFYKLLKEIK